MVVSSPVFYHNSLRGYKSSSSRYTSFKSAKDPNSVKTSFTGKLDRTSIPQELCPGQKELRKLSRML